MGSKQEIKLVINKKDFGDDYKYRLENGNLTYDNLCNIAKLYEFHSDEDKKEFNIIQASFYLKDEDENDNSLFIVNRNPIGFASENRSLSGLSFLFSFTPDDKGSLLLEDQIKEFIQNDMTFLTIKDSQDKVVKNIGITIQAKGYGYNKLKDGRIYIFYLYEVLLKSSVHIDDILYYHTIKGTKSLEYIFKISSKLMSDTSKYFMNKKASFDIAALKGIESESVETYNSAKYFPTISNNKSFDCEVEFKRGDNFWRSIVDHFESSDRFKDSKVEFLKSRKKGYSIATIMDLIRCFLIVPLGVLKLMR